MKNSFLLSGLTLLVALLYAPLLVAAAGLEVRPPRVHDGEPCLVRLEMPGLSFAAMRWRGETLFFEPQTGGAHLLIAIPAGQTAGSLPLQVLATDRAGRTRRFSGVIEVLPADRPVERLTLPPRMVNPRRPEVLARIAREGRQLQRLYDLRTPSRFWEGVQRPVNDPVSSPFGLRRILNGQPKSPHSGVDFRSPRGRLVMAPAPGKVVLADDLFYTGRTLVLDHGGGLVSVLAHLQSVRVATGAEVLTGDIVGEVGSSGRSTGPHLHWTVRLGGTRIDPLALVRLLPGPDPQAVLPARGGGAGGDARRRAVSGTGVAALRRAPKR